MSRTFRCEFSALNVKRHVTTVQLMLKCKHITKDVTARKLIADPKNWTQIFAARNANGIPVHPTDGDAVCFCAVGAVQKTTAEGGAGGCLRLIGRHLPKGTNLPQFNDSHTHEEVLQLFDKAIQCELQNS